MSVTTELLNMKQLFERMEMFVIPPYQKQFRWKEVNSRNIVLDVYRAREKSAYRLGQIVIYKDEAGRLLVIDGYQRLVSLYLIARAASIPCTFTGEREYTKESIKLIKSSYHEVKRALKSVDIDKFKSYFLEKTEIIIFTTTSLPDAFRFFDSATVRGKALDPTDLLKAYHLCAMRDVSEDDMAKVANEWEEYGKDRLHDLFELWYPLRCWAMHRPSSVFKDSEIGAFEGVEEDSKYPFTKSISPSHYSITQTIVDGKRFFALVKYANKLERRLSSLLDKFAPDLSKRVIAEFGSSDVGSAYTFLLFRSLLFLYLDRFGEESFDKAIETCFIYAFAPRMENQGIIWDDINNYILSPGSLFNTIERAIDPYEVISYDFERNLSGMRNTRQKNGERNRLIDFTKDFDFLWEVK